MSEVRKSPSQPQGPAFAGKVRKVAAPKPQPKVGTVPTHLTAGGQPARCQVMMGPRQCQNPSRHDFGGGHWSCTTHGKRIAAGRVVRWTPKVVAYDASLWGGPVLPVAQPKPKRQPKPKPQPEPVAAS